MVLKVTFFIGFELKYIERGKSFWKFNASLLTDPTFINMMNDKDRSSSQGVSEYESSGEVGNYEKEIRRKTQQYSRKEAAEDKLVNKSTE